MNQQRGLQEERDNIGPIDRVVKRIQLAGVMKAVKNERGQAKNVEMNRAWSVPAADEYKQADKNIEKRGNTQIILDRRRSILRSGHQGGLKSGLATVHLVANFGPRAHAKQNPRNVRSSAYLEAAYGLDDIPLFDAGLGGWRVRNYVPRHYALLRVQPGDPVIGKNKPGALLKV